MPDCSMPPATSPSYIGPHIYASDKICVHGRGSDVLQTVQTASANCCGLSWKLNGAKQLPAPSAHSRWQENVPKNSTTPGCCSVPRAPQHTDRASAVERPWTSLTLPQQALLCHRIAHDYFESQSMLPTLLP